MLKVTGPLVGVDVATVGDNGAMGYSVAVDVGVAVVGDGVDVGVGVKETVVGDGVDVAIEVAVASVVGEGVAVGVVVSGSEGLPTVTLPSWVVAGIALPPLSPSK